MAEDIAGQGEYGGWFGGMGHQLGGIGGGERLQLELVCIQGCIDEYHAFGLGNRLCKLRTKQGTTKRPHPREIHLLQSFCHPWPGAVVAAQRVAVSDHEQPANTFK